MKALLIIAHGSRLKASNDEVIAMKDALEPRLELEFSQIKVAFLELCEPSISQAVNELVSMGINDIVVMPFFLNKGRHVTEDVPGELDEMRQSHPGLTISLLPYFGRSEHIVKLLKDIIENHHVEPV